MAILCKQRKNVCKKALNKFGTEIKIVDDR